MNRSSLNLRVFIDLSTSVTFTLRLNLPVDSFGGIENASHYSINVLSTFTINSKTNIILTNSFPKWHHNLQMFFLLLCKWSLLLAHVTGKN